MKKTFTLWVLGALTVCSCSPFYEREWPAEGSYLFIAKGHSIEPVSTDVVLLVRVESLARCKSTEINAEPMGVLSPQSGKFDPGEIDQGSSPETLPCKSLWVLTPSDLGAIFDERGYRSSPEMMAAPRVPLYSGRTRPPVRRQVEIVIYRTVIETIYLSYNNKSIQIVAGSYGNRSGVEREHTYSVIRSGDRSYAKSERLVSRKVRYDHLPEWW